MEIKPMISVVDEYLNAAWLIAEHTKRIAMGRTISTVERQLADSDMRYMIAFEVIKELKICCHNN